MSQPREILISKKNEAKMILDHPLIQEFFETAESQLYRRWSECIEGGVKEREEIFLQQLGLKAFKDFMNKCLIDGSMAEKELEREGKL